MLYWHVSDRFCVEVIDEATDRAKERYDKRHGLQWIIHVDRESESKV